MLERRNARWTQLEIDQLIQLWGPAPLSYIASHLGRSEKAIYVKALELKLGPPNANEGDLVSTVAKKLGYHKSCIYKAIKALNITPLTPYRTTKSKKKLRHIRLTQAHQDRIFEYLFSKAHTWGITRRPSHCKKCGTNEKPYEKAGYCRDCYRPSQSSGGVNNE